MTLIIPFPSLHLLILLEERLGKEKGAGDGFHLISPSLLWEYAPPTAPAICLSLRLARGIKAALGINDWRSASPLAWRPHTPSRSGITHGFSGT